jgi:ADP-heptose:LPS heptosyltransferase
MSIVMIRLDKIGDLVSTLAVDELPALKTQKIKWVVAKGLGWIPKMSIPPREAVELSLEKNQWKFSYLELLNFLNIEKPEAVVVFYAPWWVSFACLKAGVPLRIGRKSQWHSFMFFNKSLRQSRSKSERHEADYNRELVEYGLSLSAAATTPILKLHVEKNKDLLAKYKLYDKNFIVIHPGMFGSALNWPQGHYNELISKLVLKTTVVITGTKNDERFLSEIKPKWQYHPQVSILQDQLSMNELLAILQSAKAVVAPSTGVLHLAASLSTPAIGIYSPILAHHPKRWGARGSSVTTVLPKVNCPAKAKCLGLSCSFHPCMSSISAKSIFDRLTELQII